MLKVWGWQDWTHQGNVAVAEHMSGYAVRLLIRNSHDSTVWVLNPNDKTVDMRNYRGLADHAFRWALTMGQHVVDAETPVQGPLCEQCAPAGRDGWVFGCVPNGYIDSVQHTPDKLAYLD